MYHRDPHDYLPDVKDGLTSRERIVLQCLYDLQQELCDTLYVTNGVSMFHTIKCI